MGVFWVSMFGILVMDFGRDLVFLGGYLDPSGWSPYFFGYLDP